jgi:hypothetical protein
MKHLKLALWDYSAVVILIVRAWGGNGQVVLLAVIALLLYLLVRLQFFSTPRSKAVPGLSSSISSIVLTLPFR